MPVAAARGLDGAGAAVHLADDLGEVALVPATGGAFRIDYDGELLWERKRDGGFPDASTRKQRVRDRLDPERDLGHVDRGLERPSC
jgi:selenoprotein W-related protein